MTTYLISTPGLSDEVFRRFWGLSTYGKFPKFSPPPVWRPTEAEAQEFFAGLNGIRTYDHGWRGKRVADDVQ